ncbi:MAG: twin-arginine translocase subunit TatC [Bacteroidales bacterium]|nr:twin-arginine translocase subunit TatC [Bacteroidales bacterium]
MAEKNNKTNGGETQEMTTCPFGGIWKHCGWHLLRSFIAVLVFAILAFLGRDFVFDTIILAPKSADFITNVMLCRLAELIAVKGLCIEDLNLTIVNLEMSGQFLIHLYISIIAGIIIAIPYIIGEIWAFIRPALYPDEQKHTTGAVIVTSLLFIIGVLFSYFLIVPLTINGLGTYQVSESVTNTIALRSYISTVVSLTFALGLVFEMPIFVFFITKVGLLTPAYMRRNRKYMLVIVLLLSAIITPADVFSQIMVAFPLFGLYEVSIWVSAYAYRKHQMEEEE